MIGGIAEAAIGALQRGHLGQLAIHQTLAGDNAVVAGKDSERGIVEQLRQHHLQRALG